MACKRKIVMAKEKKSRVNINNKRASFDYEFLENYTAGIVETSYLNELNA